MKVLNGGKPVPDDWEVSDGHWYAWAILGAMLLGMAGGALMAWLV